MKVEKESLVLITSKIKGSSEIKSTIRHKGLDAGSCILTARAGQQIKCIDGKYSTKVKNCGREKATHVEGTKRRGKMIKKQEEERGGSTEAEGNCIIQSSLPRMLEPRTR